MQLPVTAKEYFLSKPEQFIEKEETIAYLPMGFSLLSPIMTAVCGSDLHYYRGEKSKEKLAKRLPLILLHEGVCLNRETEKRVVPVAGYAVNVPHEFQEHENLWPDLPYLGATNHGLARTHFLYPADLTVEVPSEISSEVASLTEPFSIAIRAMEDIGAIPDGKIVIIGTGGIAFFLALALKFQKNITKENLYIFGVRDDELSIFSELGTLVNSTKEIPEELRRRVPLVFEAVGGKVMNLTMKTAFDLIAPGGRIGVTGITDGNLELSANQIVNTGLTIHGLTRSTARDYKTALELFQKPEVQSLVTKRLINKYKTKIASVEDLSSGFKFAAKVSSIGRIILEWST